MRAVAVAKPASTEGSVLQKQRQQAAAMVVDAAVAWPYLYLPLAALPLLLVVGPPVITLQESLLAATLVEKVSGKETSKAGVSSCSDGSKRSPTVSYSVTIVADINPLDTFLPLVYDFFAWLLWRFLLVCWSS